VCGGFWPNPAIISQDSMLPAWKFHELSHPADVSPSRTFAHIAQIDHGGNVFIVHSTSSLLSTAGLMADEELKAFLGGIKGRIAALRHNCHPAGPTSRATAVV